MTDKKIRDVPQIKEPLEQARTISQFKTVFPLLEPFLRIVGVNVSSVEVAFEELKDSNRKLEELATVPDRFNDLLAERGWIIYEDMDLEVAKTAIEQAEAGDMEAAENELVSYYDPETVQFHLNRMKAVEAFRPRIQLAEKALEDYEAGRYHACIPVVLALLDGLVQHVYVDVHREGRNFSAEDVDLEAWDSIAAHSKGLEQLHDLLTTGRFKTRTDEIDLPYRHGIMHGMDLGYANNTVAAKTWAALFAIREWSLKAEHDELEAPSEEPEPTVLETLLEVKESIEETKNVKQEIENWEPRNIVVGEDVPESGEPEDYNEDTPERALVDFLTFWEAERYDLMADSLVRPGIGGTEHVEDIRLEFEGHEIQSFRLIDIDEAAPARTDITIAFELNIFGKKVEGSPTVTLVRMDDDGRSAIPRYEDGSWYVTTRMKLLAPSQ